VCSWPVYTHGYSLRVRVIAVEQALRALRRELHWGDGRRWNKGKDGVVRLRGSGWLTGHRPSHRTTIGQFNRRRSMKLYNLAAQVRRDDLVIDFEGVRRRDVEHFLKGLMGLDEAEFKVLYYRKFERFVVLGQPEAWALAAAMGFEKHTYKGGRLARLEFLFKDLPIDLPASCGLRATASLTLYRVQPRRGGTAAYRLEARLRGTRRSKTTFSREDARVLDDVLGSVVRDYDLHPIVRPRLWEGDGPLPPAAPYDTRLEGLRQYAVRGGVPSWANWARHPPQHPDEACKLHLCGASGGNAAPPRLSCPNPLRLEPRCLAFADEIAGSPVNFLSEVVLDWDTDPTPMVRCLVDRLGGPGVVAVAHWSLGSSWHGIEHLMGQLPPVTGEEGALVVVVEPEIVAELVRSDGLHDDGSVNLEKLTLDFERWTDAQHQGAADNAERSVWDQLHELRWFCETTGFRAVLLTVFNPPEAGRSRAADALVRSTIGISGRHLAHVRYRIERSRVVTFKDERQGKQGRIVWHAESAWAPPFQEVHVVRPGASGRDAGTHPHSGAPRELSGI